MASENETYTCKECGFEYEEKSWKDACEAWCKEHRSCNLEIIAHGTPPGADKNHEH